MASKKSGKRAAAAWDSPLVKRRNDLIQREVRYLADEGEDLPRVLLQWRGIPPLGMGSKVPFSRKRCTHRIAELTPTSNCSAASRRDPPSGTKSMTRVLNPPGYGSCIGQPSGPIECVKLAPPACLGNPDSSRSGRAVARIPLEPILSASCAGRAPRRQGRRGPR